MGYGLWRYGEWERLERRHQEEGDRREGEEQTAHRRQSFLSFFFLPTSFFFLFFPPLHLIYFFRNSKTAQPQGGTPGWEWEWVWGHAQRRAWHLQGYPAHFIALRLLFLHRLASMHYFLQSPVALPFSFFFHYFPH